MQTSKSSPVAQKKFSFLTRRDKVILELFRCSQQICDKRNWSTCGVFVRRWATPLWLRPCWPRVDCARWPTALWCPWPLPTGWWGCLWCRPPSPTKSWVSAIEKSNSRQECYFARLRCHLAIMDLLWENRQLRSNDGFIVLTHGMELYKLLLQWITIIWESVAKKTCC